MIISLSEGALMEKDWTKDLEHDEYEFDIELIIKDALEAIEITK
jgi:hypothetical protein